MARDDYRNGRIGVKKCIHCKEPNEGNWFYCKECGKQASEPKYTTNMWMMSQMGKRTDIELSSQTMDDNIKSMRKNIGHI